MSVRFIGMEEKFRALPLLCEMLEIIHSHFESQIHLTAYGAVCGVWKLVKMMMVRVFLGRVQFKRVW